MNESVAAPPLPPPEPVTIRVPVGAVLEVRLAEPMSTQTHKAGDEFVAILDQDVVVDGKVVFPEGAKAYGTLLAAEGSGRVEGRAEMTITLTELRLREEPLRVKTGNITIQAEGTQSRDAKVIGGAAGVGAVLGGIIAGKKGVAVGAAVGGGAGTATVLTTKGKEVEFEPEHKFSFSFEPGSCSDTPLAGVRAIRSRIGLTGTSPFSTIQHPFGALLKLSPSGEVLEWLNRAAC